ncbi:hypothetical protein [Microbacterium sp. 77mftsu3.1]|uniref:hypothetical protein n=1 Tax=Microbacterium sp. 77mftsu3.1 TaxID=1761802 RepID=UPI000361F2C9|nr:hypothetical protein [Microbacterium sp. 77mftsu3.1]SDH42526.1 hypothetical protein SAMN04488590_3309 [Microbacterium sp. 77mftsu3.1]
MMSHELSSLLPQRVTPGELELLTYAAFSPDEAVADDTHSHAVRAARSLARKGLVKLLAGAAAGWEPGVWMATLTCPGWNALWRANGDKHEPGCGMSWLPEGICGGCGAERPLDAAAWDAYALTLPDAERARAATGSKLWCDEHGYIRPENWTTDKTCRQAGSPRHERILTRV